MSTEPLLQIKGITKAFGGIMALEDVSFEVHEGEILGIIGPNGSGKTTVVNCITGFIKKTAGRVFFRGKDITNKPPHKLAWKLGPRKELTSTLEGGWGIVTVVALAPR